MLIDLLRIRPDLFDDHDPEDDWTDKTSSCSSFLRPAGGEATVEADDDEETAEAEEGGTG